VRKRVTGLLGSVMLLTSACGSDGPSSDSGASREATPPEVPAALTDQSSFTGITLPPEFDLANARGFRTADAGAGTDGSRRDSWELADDRLTTLWRDDAGVEYVTTVDLDGTPMWHTQLPQLLDPAGDRPLQPILERIPTAEGPDWLVVTNIGSQQSTGPITTRVLTLNADTGEVALDFTLPTYRVSVVPGVDSLSVAIWDEEYLTFYTLLVDLLTGQQQRFDNPEVDTADILYLDSVIGFLDGKPIYTRDCTYIRTATPAADACMQTQLIYDGQEYDAETDFLPLPRLLLGTQAGQQLVADNPDGLPVDLPCRTGFTRGVPESPNGRYIVVGSNLIDLQTNTTICTPDPLWWTAIDDEGRGWGRREGTTTLRVTYDVATQSIDTAEVPGAQSPLAITHGHQGVFGVTGDGTDVLLLAPQHLDR
jgi:hypothetical protein